MKLNPFLMGRKSTFTPAFLPTMLVLTLILSALVGCAGHEPKQGNFEGTPVTIEVKVPYLCGQPPPVDAVLMRDINWEIIEVEGLVFDEGDDPYTGELFTLLVEEYQALGLNTSDFIAAAAQLKAQRDFYRDCIIRSRQEIHDENLDAGLVPDIPAERDGGEPERRNVGVPTGEQPDS